MLYSFPAAMPADLEQGLAAFCFPHGVRPELLERTPSMSGGWTRSLWDAAAGAFSRAGCSLAVEQLAWEAGPAHGSGLQTPPLPLPATCLLVAALNEVIYSQPYQTHDDHSFVFTMKVSRCSACGGYLEHCRGVLAAPSPAACLSLFTLLPWPASSFLGPPPADPYPPGCGPRQHCAPYAVRRVLLCTGAGAPPALHGP